MTENTVYCTFWINEFINSLEPSWDVSYQIPFDNALPIMTVGNALELVNDHTKSYNLIYPHSDAFVKIKSQYTFASEEIDIPLFYPIGSTRDENSIAYTKSLHQLLKIQSDWLLTENCDLEMLRPNVGHIKASEENKSLLIGTPIYKRTELTRVFIKYMLEYFIPQLRWEGYYTQLALVGSEEDYEAVKDICNDSVAYVQRENCLGTKKNTILDIARATNVDSLMWIDSDDFFHPRTAETLISMAHSNGIWSAIEDFSFYNSENKQFTYFSGYGGSHQLYEWGMGSGRVFTSHLINTLIDPFPPRNKSMDDGVKKVLGSFNVKPQDRLLRNTIETPLGVKTSQNIWEAKSYGSDTMQAPSWLPPKIKNLILDIEFNNKK
jgi:hypothetical protein